MNENDKKIRKQWLVMWILSLLIGISGILLQQFVDPSIQTFPLGRYAAATISISCLCVFSAASYYFIYKKPGTKFLTFFLILTLINLIMMPIFYLNGTLPSHTLYNKILLMVSMGINIGWLITCWRMRKTNKRLQMLNKMGL